VGGLFKYTSGIGHAARDGTNFLNADIQSCDLSVADRMHALSVYLRFASAIPVYRFRFTYRDSFRGTTDAVSIPFDDVGVGRCSGTERCGELVSSLIYLELPDVMDISVAVVAAPGPDPLLLTHISAVGATGIDPNRNLPVQANFACLDISIGPNPDNRVRKQIQSTPIMPFPFPAAGLPPLGEQGIFKVLADSAARNSVMGQPSGVTFSGFYDMVDFVAPTRPPRIPAQSRGLNKGVVTLMQQLCVTRDEALRRADEAVVAARRANETRRQLELAATNSQLDSAAPAPLPAQQTPAVITQDELLAQIAALQAQLAAIQPAPDAQS